ncbi:MAG: hypothetical protein GXY33_12410 [Phycisphaerae bacterium]|mgnify:CR=1 FL=1|nr:hypothetical protein [Phycisphaerae bacterium]
MSDQAYFFLLFLVILCGVVAPAFAWTAFVPKLRNRALGGLVVVCVVGVALSFPFRATQEMWWLPTLAVLYFPLVVLAAILHGVSVLIEACASAVESKRIVQGDSE